jgi:predicted amidohydrolase
MFRPLERKGSAKIEEGPEVTKVRKRQIIAADHRFQGKRTERQISPKGIYVTPVLFGFYFHFFPSESYVSFEVLGNLRSLS